MPFAGDLAAAEQAGQTLRGLRLGDGDELILADNTGAEIAAADGIRVIQASGERSPARARNAGAAHARGEWILFLDADTRAPAALLDDYLSEPVDDDVGALAGEVIPAGDPISLAERYGAARNFLGHRSHLAHPYLPRAAAANLIVRRTAFEALGGFHEGLRAAEDTDFSWRLQQAGWRLQPRPEARVEHRYRSSIGELRAQWRGYAAGRAWLGRRYDGFAPEPAVRRRVRRLSGQVTRALPIATPPSEPRDLPARSPTRSPLGPDLPARSPGLPVPGKLDRLTFAGLDAVLGFEELAGLMLSNRPGDGSAAAAEVVVVVDRFPAPDDPFVGFVAGMPGARVEASGRPPVVDRVAAGSLEIAFREDDGALTRAGALLRLVARHPLRCALDRLRRKRGEPSLAGLAPAALRLEDGGRAPVRALGGAAAQATARRLAALAGPGPHPGP